MLLAGRSLNLDHHLRGAVSCQVIVKVKAMESSVDGGLVDRDPHGAKEEQIPSKHLCIGR